MTSKQEIAKLRARAVAALSRRIVAAIYHELPPDLAALERAGWRVLRHVATGAPVALLPPLEADDDHEA